MPIYRESKREDECEHGNQNTEPFAQFRFAGLQFRAAVDLPNLFSLGFFCQSQQSVERSGVYFFVALDGLRRGKWSLPMIGLLQAKRHNAARGHAGERHLQR